MAHNLSVEGKLLVQQRRDVFVSVQNDHDVWSLEWIIPHGLQPFDRIHLEVRSPEGLHVLCRSLNGGALAEQAAKVWAFELDIATVLDSTLADLSTIFHAMTRVQRVQLLFPDLPTGALFLHHEQTISSLVTESSTIWTLRAPAPPLTTLCVTVRLPEEKHIYFKINHLFRESLVNLRIVRQYEPYHLYPSASPARICFCLELPHLEHLEVRDISTLADSGFGDVDAVATSDWAYSIMRYHLPSLMTLVWAPPWYNFYEFGQATYTAAVAEYQRDLERVLPLVKLVLCVSRTGGIVSYRVGWGEEEYYDGPDTQAQRSVGEEDWEWRFDWD